jgi:hypothetical protein
MYCVNFNVISFTVALLNFKHPLSAHFEFLDLLLKQWLMYWIYILQYLVKLLVIAFSCLQVIVTTMMNLSLTV